MMGKTSTRSTISHRRLPNSHRLSLYRLAEKFVLHTNSFHKIMNSTYCRAIGRARTTTINHNINTNQLNKACFTIKPTIHSPHYIYASQLLPYNTIATTPSPPERQPFSSNFKQLRTHTHDNLADHPDNLPSSTPLLSMTLQIPVVLLFTRNVLLLRNIYLPTIPCTTYSTKPPNDASYPPNTTSNDCFNQFLLIRSSSSLDYSHH